MIHISRESLRKYAEQNQIISVSETIKKFKLSAPSVYRFIKEEGMERISKGVYAYPDTWIDEMKILSDRTAIAVFSHESALQLHHLTDREPEALTVTVPSNYNASHLIKTGVKVFYTKQELFGIGKIELPSPEGNLVPCYNLERTICDILRSRSQLDKQVFYNALKLYVMRKDKRLDILKEYSEQFKVKQLLSQYLEVLL